ncbi:MAG: hypothetical protein H0W83_04800 [Planctomycetes bacterium]|nr:hypothetical protein [Planctomycetota bacterium]
MAALPNTSPIQTGPPRAMAPVAFTTANTNRDGTGTIADIVSNVSPLAPNGALVRWISVCTTAASTITGAGMLRFYIHDGTTYRLFRELPVTAITPSATVKGWSLQTITGEADISNGRWNLNMELPPGYKLGVSTHIGDAFVACASVADF